MNSKVVTLGLAEFQEEKIKELTVRMEWMKSRDMILIKNIEELSDFVGRAISSGRCAVDLETDSLNVRKGYKRKIVGFCLSYRVQEGVYVPINHQEDAELNLPEKEVLFEIKRLCDNCVTIFHNAKFDCAFLQNYGIMVKDCEKFEDTMILARLYDAGRKQIGLKTLSQEFLNQPMLEFADMNKAKRFDLVSPKIGYVYAASDAICTLGLDEFFLSQDIIKNQEQIYKLEKRIVPIVRRMEANLVRIDQPYLSDLEKKVEVRIEQIKKDVCSLAGRDFNIGSSQQLGRILFEDLRYEYPSNIKTKSGQYSTDNATLEKIADRYPIVKKIIEYRGLDKSLGTYIRNLLANSDADGCVKLNFNQVGTDTGRFSSPGGDGLQIDGSSGVNVQSIPSNYSEDAPDIRRAFIARPGYKMVAIDYSGEELRIATNLSKEPKWMNEFLNGDGDLHTATGRAIFGRQEITKAERQISKTTNFLTLYGGGSRGLAQQAKISEREARRVLSSFFTNLPKLKRWIDIEKLKARKQKFVQTSFGRIRPLHMYYDSGDHGLMAHADRCAVNTLVQGAGADIMKIAMVRVHNWIESENLHDDIRLLITMHDEIVFEIREDKLLKYIPQISQIMRLDDLLQGQLKWEVPLVVDAEYGDSWHVDHDFFKELTDEQRVEIERNITKVSFHGTNETTEQTVKAEEMPEEPQKEPEKASSPVPDPKPEPDRETVQEAPQKATEAPQEPKLDNPIQTLGPDGLDGGKNGVFVYAISETSKAVARRINIILDFLEEEEKKNKKYCGPKKKLLLKDLNDNSLLVEDKFVRADAFLALARFFKI